MIYIQASQKPKPRSTADCSQLPENLPSWIFIFFFIWKNWEKFLALTTGKTKSSNQISYESQGLANTKHRTEKIIQKPGQTIQNTNIVIEKC